MPNLKNNCGTCIFARKSLNDAPEGAEQQVFCIFGEEQRGPYNESASACLAFVRKRQRAKRAAKSPSPEKAKYYINLDMTEWTEENDNALKQMFDRRMRISDMAISLGIDRVSIAKRINKLGLKHITRQPRKNASEPIVDGNNLPLTEQKYPGVRCCHGRCCKYKTSCQHYLHWVEMGNPQKNLINSVGRCINTNYGLSHQCDSNQVFIEYLGIDGSKSPDPLTFAETC